MVKHGKAWSNSSNADGEINKIPGKILCGSDVGMAGFDHADDVSPCLSVLSQHPPHPGEAITRPGRNRALCRARVQTNPPGAQPHDSRRPDQA
jgi:hypothetical protein